MLAPHWKGLESLQLLKRRPQGLGVAATTEDTGVGYRELGVEADLLPGSVARKDSEKEAAGGAMGPGDRR